MNYPMPSDENGRLKALYELELLDTPMSPSSIALLALQ
ncbi:hypothetical protein CZ787_03870 [Halomonas citrativorans]|uniref:Uncharacterized protein n=1 Tax=Halomonas citrativorans TaxID=2742612 RepID=A0A1R4HSI8_9GAMM|nr:hypothetical protein CZ787_03870 [Halomonas citrativorans]